MYELERFLKENENWEEILTGEPYYIKVKRDGPYVMFNYDQLRSDFSSILVQQSRGIIFREATLEPVCVPFFKFFNVGELNAADIDWNTAFVSEKVDGSLIKVWWDGNWNISTNGTIDAFKAELGDVKFSSFGEYFINTLLRYYENSTEFYCHLDTDYTYMFELVGPYNRVVIPYEEPAIYFIGARDKTTGEEFCCSKVVAGALGMGRFNRPAQYSLSSLSDCIKAAELKSWDDEGFVVCDAWFNRVKIKSPAYVMAHYARNNNVINRKYLIRIILANEIEEFLCYATDYKEELEKVQNLMRSFSKVGNEIAKSCQRLVEIPRRVYAVWVKTLPKIYQDLAFRNYDNVTFTDIYTANWSENKWDNYLTDFEKLKQQYFN